MDGIKLPPLHNELHNEKENEPQIEKSENEKLPEIGNILVGVQDATTTAESPEMDPQNTETNDKLEIPTALIHNLLEASVRDPATETPSSPPNEDDLAPNTDTNITETPEPEKVHEASNNEEEEPAAELKLEAPALLEQVVDQTNENTEEPVETVPVVATLVIAEPEKESPVESEEEKLEEPDAIKQLAEVLTTNEETPSPVLEEPDAIKQLAEVLTTNEETPSPVLEEPDAIRQIGDLVINFDGSETDTEPCPKLEMPDAIDQLAEAVLGIPASEPKVAEIEETYSNNLLIAEKPSMASQLLLLKRSMSRRGSVMADAKRKIDDTQCALYVDNFEKKKEIPPYQDRDIVIKYILREGTKAITDRDYKKAEYMNDLNTRLLAAIIENEKNEYCLNRESIIEAEINSTKDKIMVTEREWKSRIRNAIESNRKKEQDLKEDHQTQIRKFDEYYEDPEHLRQYSKQSAALLQLRSKERRLVMCNRYMEAKVLNKEAEKIEEEETESMQALAEQEVLLKKTNMLKRHKDELLRAKDYSMRVVDRLKTRMDHDLELHNRRLAVLQKSKENPGNTVIAFYGGEVCDAYGVKSPRTRKQMNEFRSSIPGKKLELKPVNNLAKKCPKPTKPRVVWTSMGSRK